MLRFFLKRPCCWGSLFIAIAVIGSNIGSAWAGTRYEALLRYDPLDISVPPSYGFTIMAWTVYPLSITVKLPCPQ